MSRKDAMKKLRETLVRRRDALQRALQGDLSLLQELHHDRTCLLYTSPSPRDLSTSRMPSSA